MERYSSGKACEGLSFNNYGIFFYTGSKYVRTGVEYTCTLARYTCFLVYLSMPKKKQDSRKNGGKNMGRVSPAEFIRETAVVVRGSVRPIAPRREYGNVSGLCT